MYGVDSWCAKLSLDSMLLILGLAGFNQFFQNAGFWPLPGQNVVLVFIQVSVPRWVGELSYMSISCTLFVAKCVCFMFFRLWGSRMIVSGLEASLVLWFGSWQNGGVDYWSAKLSLGSMLLIWGLAGFNQFFQNVGFWPLPGQNVFFLASSGAECLPGVHSDVRA